MLVPNANLNLLPSDMGKAKVFKTNSYKKPKRLKQKIGKHKSMQVCLILQSVTLFFMTVFLTHAVRLGVIPAHFAEASKLNQVDQQFYLARGRAPNCTDVAALQMTK